MGYLKISMQDNFSAALMKKLQAAGPRAAHTVAVQVVKDTEPFVPARTKSLANRTQVTEGLIIYPGPYARYLYYGKVMVDSVTGKGPMHFVDKQGNEVIAFRKGAVLKATERDLHISTAVHSQAQPHWFEASKAQNLEKWKRVAERTVSRELDK